MRRQCNFHNAGWVHVGFQRDIAAETAIEPCPKSTLLDGAAGGEEPILRLGSGRDLRFDDSAQVLGPSEAAFGDGQQVLSPGLRGRRLASLNGRRIGEIRETRASPAEKFNACCALSARVATPI